jgi:hypothetical protein
LGSRARDEGVITEERGVRAVVKLKKKKKTATGDQAVGSRLNDEGVQRAVAEDARQPMSSK